MPKIKIQILVKEILKLKLVCKVKFLFKKKQKSLKNFISLILFNFISLKKYKLLLLMILISEAFY